MLCLALGGLLFAGAAAAGAQTFTGGLRGAVRDAQGVIPGVAVQMVNEATNVTREVVTNEVGEYSFPAVQPGTYTVRSSLAGYRTFERRGIRVGTQQFVTIDVLLEVGAIEEQITVTADAPLIETSRADTGGVLDRQALETLPSPGRNAFLIGITVPTVNPTGDPQFNRQQDQTNASLISLGGGGIRANNYLVDGVPIGELQGRAVLNPTIEAVEEVKVQVHTYDAEMGRTGGGVFNTTMKSGTNTFRGTGFYQTRPVWGQEENFFNKAAGRTKEETGLADAYYRLWGGGFGGPVVCNRTFFWTAMEGYRSLVTRNLAYILPTPNQRQGNFAGTTVGGGPARLFNPYCRSGVASAQCPAAGTGSLATGGEFTGGIIPLTHPAVSPVGVNLINAFPTASIQGPMELNEDANPNVRATANLVDEAEMYAFKVDHRFSDRWSLTGSYIYNNTDEPGNITFPDSHAFMDDEHWILRRRPHVLVLNNTNIINDTTVLTLRYGWSTWQDQVDKIPFSPGLSSLGFNQGFVSAAAEKDVFPFLNFNDVFAGNQGGNRRRWNGPYAINANLSKLMGSHSFKFGVDVRELGITTTNESNMGGVFSFDERFTSAAGVADSGHELASLLLGLPSSARAPVNRAAGEWFVRYYSGYVQDEWRVNSRFTLNYGVRLEHEDGLREIEDRQTVAFDRNVVNPLDALVPKAGTPLAGQTLRGGLVYAGVNGAPSEQGDLATLRTSPRVGTTYAIDDRTVLRGGYGLFFAPWQYSFGGQRQGNIGFSRDTFIAQSTPQSEVPLTTLDNAFATGLVPPVGSSLGPLTGAGASFDFVDQDKGDPKVHQYSVDLQRELPGNMAVTIGYVGATGRDLGFAGTGIPSININQIDPNVARQVFPDGQGGWDAAALQQSIPNPFFGIAEAGEFGLRPTIQVGQLLRPFPQFGDIRMRETTEGGRRQYHAATFILDKRLGGSGLSQYFGGRYSYTWSRTEDNQFGQANAYSFITNVPQNNYDLDAEYSRSNFDSPHRIILAPIIRLPSPAETGTLKHTVLGGWNVSAIVELVSGPPLNATMSSGRSSANLGLFGGRQRPTVVGDPNTSGSDTERVSTAANPSARWFDASAFQNPGPGRYGTAPRTIADAREQFRKNLDLVVAKDTRLAGGQSAEVRFEILNLTNTAKFRGSPNNVDLGSFGRNSSQRGFMRIWQISFRYKF